MEAVSVPCHTGQLHPLFVALAMLLQLGMGVDFKQVLISTHQR